VSGAATFLALSRYYTWVIAAFSQASRRRYAVWVIVAVTLGFSDTPKLTLIPGPEFATEADCVRATHAKGQFDSEKGGGSLEFSFCVPKDSVQIGQPSGPDGQKNDR
jgi:hypothetical protein